MNVKKLFCLLFAVLALFSAACGQTLPETVTIAGINDPSFSKGFNLKGTSAIRDGSTVFKRIDFGDATNNPVWELCQWNSRFNLKSGEETVTDENYSLEDSTKRVLLDRRTGALTLGVDTDGEYDTSEAVREEWAHLLIEQSLLIANRPVSQAERIDVSLDFTIGTMEKSEREFTQASTQLAWFLYMKNVNPSSEGFNDFLWFGLNLYNYNYAYAPSHASQDTAMPNGNFIYSLGAKETLGEEKVKPGKAISLRLDVKPFLEQALETAHERNYMVHTTIDDSL